MRTIISILLIIVVVGVSPSNAIDLNLVKAIDLAKAHSHELKAAAMRADAFEEALGMTKAERYPTLSLSSQALYNSEVTKFELEVSPGVTVGREFGNKEVFLTNAKITLPLFTGGRISGAINIAREKLDYQKTTQKVYEDQVILNTRIAYFTFSSAQWQTEAAEASLRRAKTIFDDVTALYNSGAADSIDILETSAALTKAELNLATANSNRHESQINLNLILGLDAEEPITLIDNSIEPEITSTLSSENYIARSELLLSESSIAIAEASIDIQRASYWPTLSAFGGYTYGKPNLDPFGNSWNDYFTVGALLSWDFNLGNQSKRGVNQTNYLRDAAKHEYGRVDQLMNQQARISVEQVRLAIERYKTAQTIYQLSSQQYRLAREKSLQGDLSPNRVVEIEAALAEAEANRAASVANYHIAMSAYYHATASEKLREGI